MSDGAISQEDYDSLKSQYGSGGKDGKKNEVTLTIDDFDYTYLQGLITYPFVSFICAPKETNIGPFKRKKIAYNGYQKLAYLHPNVFVPDYNKLGGIDVNQPFFILRLVNLVAHHDVNIKGLNGDLIDQIVKKLEKRGVVYISSEKELSKDLQKFTKV